jgi:glycogen debranching enzyme
MPQARVHRREFLQGLGAMGVASVLPQLLCGQAPPVQMGREELSALLRKLLVTDDPKLYDFAVEAYATCVLGKLKPPDPPLAHAWIVPGGGYYAQWLWDTMFVADLLALLPGQDQTIRGVFQNYWDFQQRWNEAKPGFMHGMVANFMAPFDAPDVRPGKQWRTFPAYSQAPLLAWGMERVYLRNGDKELLRAGLAPLESFHDWYWRERDVTGVGLVGVGSYSGDAQHARYETYDREVDLDDLKMTPHPRRPTGPDNGAWYGDILIPANTAYLLLSELSLERMAAIMGDHTMAGRRRARYAKGAEAMRQHMWSQSQGCFLAVHRDTLRQIPTATVGGFMPLMAHVPSIAQAATMAATLAKPAWATPLPIPTVARTSPQFSASEFWRGDVWPAPNYQVATGLAGYGQRAAAARIADLTVANALRNGISERYDSLTGATLGVRGLGMSATALTMLLDGLTSRYTLRVREPRQ